MDWDSISGLLPAALIIALVLRKALRRRQKPDTPPAGPRRVRDSTAKFKRDYEPIEPK